MAVSGTNYNAWNTYNLIKTVNSSKPYHANTTVQTSGGVAWCNIQATLSNNQLTFGCWTNGGPNTITFQRWYLHAYVQ